MASASGVGASLAAPGDSTTVDHHSLNCRPLSDVTMMGAGGAADRSGTTDSSGTAAAAPPQ